MNEVVEFLKRNRMQVLATMGLDGKPKARPFMFALEKDGKLWYCTANTKDVYAQMQKCPFVEVTVSSPEFAWIRLSGRAVFENDMAVKTRILDENPLVKSLYGSPSNPAFETFYLADAEATIADFSGNPPRKYRL